MRSRPYDACASCTAKAEKADASSHAHTRSLCSTGVLVQLRGSFRKLGATHPSKDPCLHLHVVGTRLWTRDAPDIPHTLTALCFFFEKRTSAAAGSSFLLLLALTVHICRQRP